MKEKKIVVSSSQKRGGYESVIQHLDEVGAITIEPFLSGKENLGLEKYGMVLFPHTKHKEDLSCVVINGKIRFINGLDEFAPSIISMENKAEKEEKIKTIRETVSYLEKVLSANVVDPEDDDFWNKVKTLRPDNKEFWSKISLEIGNEVITLNPKKDPNDLILYMAIEAGGFSEVAKSYEDAKKSVIEPKFFLNKRIITATNKASVIKVRNKAISLLESIYDDDFDKMFYIAKILDIANSTYKKHTPKDIIYNFLDDYINGESHEKNKTKAAQTFIDIFNLDIETLKLRAIIRDAVIFRVFVTKPDGALYHMNTNTYIGKNQKDALAYLKNVTNADIMKLVIEEVENYW